MVQPQSADVLSRIPRQDRLVASRNSSVGRIDGSAKPDLWKIRVDKFLDVGI